ncbi:MAG TPA: hypothetical protein VG605_08920 [Puia sp.]|nr:hypothetical protein [Puia sp.]
MAWSKVYQPWQKPLRWWFHKLLCEWNYFEDDMPGYYRHLNALCKEGYNLYGKKL